MIHYFDNAATTPVRPEAVQAAVEAMTQGWGNPSSRYALGSQAAEAVKRHRAQAAAGLGCRPEELFFTSCGTEGDNWAGNISLDDLEGALRPDTVLVSMMLVNNELGTVLPVAQAAKLVHQKTKALVHCDAVQGFLKVPFTPKELGADLLTVSGHKIHAPKGIGALYIRGGLKFPPMIRGGGQESGLRSGTGHRSDCRLRRGGGGGGGLPGGGYGPHGRPEGGDSPAAHRSDPRSEAGGGGDRPPYSGGHLAGL